MLQIAGGILIAYFVIATIDIWLPILFFIACAAIVAVLLFFCLEYPVLLLVLTAFLIKSSKTAQKAGPLKAALIFFRKFVRCLRTSNYKYTAKQQIKGLGNLLLTVVYCVLCILPLYTLGLFAKSEFFSYLIAPIIFLSFLIMYLIFIKYPHKTFIKIK